MGHDDKTCPAEENVEAICQFFNTIGKQLDESPKSRRFNDVYFNRLKELTTNPQLPSRLRFMVRNILDLRANNWIPRREEVNSSTLTSFFLSFFFRVCVVEGKQGWKIFKIILVQYFSSKHEENQYNAIRMQGNFIVRVTIKMH